MHCVVCSGLRFVFCLTKIKQKAEELELPVTFRDAIDHAELGQYKVPLMYAAFAAVVVVCGPRQLILFLAVKIYSVYFILQTFASVSVHPAFARVLVLFMIAVATGWPMFWNCSKCMVEAISSSH